MGGYFSSLRAKERRIVEDIEEYDPHGPDRVVQPARAVQLVIDESGLDGFQWKVWLVAASGFFTTSYSIFAVNVVSPALSYVYPECRSGWSTNSLALTLTTLIGTMVGMVLFGHLADRYGRKAIYGFELGIVVVATVGMTTASSGHRNSMNVYGWIGFWRALLGIGLGAEYPLSAIIAAEWSSTKSRGKMIAAVFLMQSIGQLAAYALGLVILYGVGSALGLSRGETDYEVASPVIDVVWRVTIGIGAIPALISLILRRIIPETPYYLAEKGKVADAMEAAVHLYARDGNVLPTDQGSTIASRRSSGIFEPAASQYSGAPQPESRGRESWIMAVAKYVGEVKRHLAEKGRWRALVGVMATWWILDLAFYGLGLDNPNTISTIWLSKPPPQSDISTSPGELECRNATWRADPARPDITIYEMLEQDSIRSLLTISTGALPGSLIILFAIDYLPRTTWMGWMFVVLAGLFAINGGTFFVTFQTDKHALTVTLYVLAQVIFNLGPNTMTFILPAELFATKYRGTFYGLAAASGKLGAVTILLFMKLGINEYNHEFAGMLLGFCPAMLLGAFITWVWIPEVQYPRGHEGKPVTGDDASDAGVPIESEMATFRRRLKLPNIPLADIAENPGQGQILGMRRNIARLFRGKRTQGGDADERKNSAEEGARMFGSDEQRDSVDDDGRRGDSRLEEVDVSDGLEARETHRGPYPIRHHPSYELSER
ncbi:MFS general substrate transporter [Durotheca rogersii]|uniref:MFS general substrate transporter n=1 Tax=Durotheca rogersii TaxID=419775 RepID=UPI00221E85AD|nr:MFS general substrate transporter [Durotheca rogersii]KAI5864028.1 MFS general substrate transporter [Durotheca rogersii]